MGSGDTMKINIPEIGLYEQDDSNLALWAILLLRAIQNNELFTNQAVTMLSTEALPYCATPVRSLYGSDGDDLLWRPLEWLTELKGVIDREDGVYYEIMPAPMCLKSWRNACFRGLEQAIRHLGWARGPPFPIACR